ncbi:MAG: 4'-phosphopantetheinyl transferase superfamily protein [Xanthomonadales bacterium]|nr:4'-phosphopantetheinyl transferase superfamily protein [Xanthomonadales bacterium]
MNSPVRLWLRRLAPVPAGADAMQRARWRKQAARAALLERLATELPGFSPSQLLRDPLGKPSLAPPFAHLTVNASDSGDWHLVGLAEGPALGVDIECVLPRPTWRALAQRWFDPAELEWLDSLDDPEHGFLRLWSLKEALFKAHGRGLAYGLHRARFGPSAQGRLVLQRLEGPAAPARQWQCRELACGSDMVMAVAWQGVEREVSLQVAQADMHPHCDG